MESSNEQTGVVAGETMTLREQAEQAARAFCEEFSDEFVMKESIERLTTLLLARDKALLSEVAKQANDMHDVVVRSFKRKPDHFLQRDMLLDFADWCRQQAEARKGAT